MKIRFGIQDRKVTSGAGLYLKIFQIISLLPLPYIFLVTLYPAVIAGSNIFSILFDLGLAALPRAQALLMSLLYRLTLNEIIVYFIPLVTAFVWGLVMKKILNGPEKGAVLIRKILIIVLLCDLVLRLLPFPFNYSFAWYDVVFGCVVRAACLLFLILDLKRKDV